jgi:protein SCO1/2
VRHGALLSIVSRWVSTLTVAAAIVASTPAVTAASPVANDEIKSRTERLPKRLEGIDVEEHLEATVPKALAFVDDGGRTVMYDEVVRGKLPTILTLNYSDCPMLCSLQLNALLASMKQLDLELGRDFRVVTVSLNPKETPAKTRDWKNKYLAQYGRADVPKDGWTFLNGSEANIRAVARGLGFSYSYNEKRDEYAHPAAFVITTKEGVISRYLYGLEYHPKTLRLSLIEASEGKIGSSIDRLILYCFHYDASEGRYAPVAMNIMRVSGSAGALALGGLLAGLWRSESRRKRKAPAAKIAS